MNVKRALTRKFGPLPAWTWALIALGSLYYYRKYRGGTGVVSGTGTGSVGPAPATPQPQTTLQPGESVYDPNSGSLTTAPGGGSSGGGSADTTSADALTAAMNNLAGAIASGEPAPPGTPTGPGASPGVAPGTKNKRHPPKLTGRGAIRAPSGHKAPRAPKGYKDKGQGHGFWEFVPKRTPKDKGQKKARGKTSQHQRPGHPAVKRSATTHRATTGGRTRGRTSSAVYKPSINRGPQVPKVAKALSRLRQPTRTPAVHTVVQQRRPAQTPRPATRAPVGHAPKPSAPPPRTQRAPSKAPARPAARKRK